MHKPRLLVMAGISAVLFFACDMPPDAPLSAEDTDSLDSEIEIETDSQIGQETDVGTTCIEALMCIITTPDESLSCFEGLDEADRTAALSLSFCAADACFDVVDNLVSFGLCLVQDCGQESADCVGASLSGAFR